MDETIDLLHISSKNKKTPEEIHSRIIKYVKEIFENKKLELKKIDQEKTWGREHCEYCFCDLNPNEKAYTENEKYWLCQDCYTKHKIELNLKS